MSNPQAVDIALRDWFAGQALVGVVQVCANDEMNWKIGETRAEYFARKSYEVADAMLAARVWE